MATYDTQIIQGRGRRTVVGRTTVQRLLDWSACPMPANKAVVPWLVKQIQRMPERLAWYGAASVTAILHMREWPEGLALAEQYARELPPFTLPESVARRDVWDVSGDEFDRDRFDSGVDECWQTRKRRSSRSKPILRLTVAIGGLHDKQAEDLVWMGVAAFAIADAAEAAGYRLEIDAVSTQSHDDHGDATCVQIVRVKEADEPLDRETAIMAMGSPAFFRHHVIASRAAVHAAFVPDRNAGSTMETPPEYRGDLHMPLSYSAEAATDAVNALVRRINGLADGTEDLAA